MSATVLKLLQRRSGYMFRLWSHEEYETLLKDPRTIITQDTYGFALGRIIEDEAELLMIAVTKGRQRQGHGSRYLQAFEAILTKKGAKCCFLEVAESNRKAQALYRARNFEEIGRRKAYYRLQGNNHMDAIIMRKTFIKPQSFD